jgi:hypothetical protein
MTDAVDELHNLAHAVGGLRPDWRDAERFYEACSEIVAALRRLAGLHGCRSTNNRDCSDGKKRRTYDRRNPRPPIGPYRS